MLGKLLHKAVRDFALAGPLFGKLQHGLFELAVDAALLISFQISDLRFAETGLLTDGLVVMQSIVTAVQLARLQVSQLPEFGF